ncbi:S-adenosyl-L-methionine-dependent methyltransferase [Pterulicium gracile]|uniref:S-adenosyl-L-methionine-dependent methyltransferase n=1 Tax=Pterulicium gracile TaxID=1884261 RepID=A0A5C3QRY8_9AGAR|nr:S-adenosyl-L-methionine-dependent methyltransferase [Pterula gracilis]
MGKKRGGARRRDTGKPRKDDESRDDVITKIDMKNAPLEAYYKAQNIVPEEEWNTFFDALKQPLPTTFRMAGSRQVAHELNHIIKTSYVPNMADTVFEGEPVAAPVQIPWYPEGLAWQFNVPKKVLRKSPEFKKFHSFLVFETEVGNISRQEGVSMIPPLLLDVEPHHYVLDLCAAPGSKTAQLLEAIHREDTATTTSVPSGLLIANDSDQKRTHLLIHQSARLPSPTFMVTNLDASIYPIMKLQAPGRNKHTNQLLFDRILCDVPCSGDGTLRKNLGIWKRWGPGDGNGLHSLQLRILERAMKLLKKDGRIVYSTCSMNPIENEAVVAAALQSNPEFELIDVSHRLPELKRRPGLSTWRVTPDKTVGTLYDTEAEFTAAGPSAAGSNAKLAASHWPPANAAELGLERCLRIYPHLQDSGAFFVAVLERKSKAKASVTAQDRKRGAESPVPQPEAKKPKTDATPEQTDVTVDVDVEPELAEGADTPHPTEGSAEEPKERGPDTTFKENPYTFLAADDPNVLTCIEQLHLTPSFPSSNVLVRNPAGDGVRALYLTNDIVKTLIQHNDYSRIRLTSAGIKTFIRQDAGKDAAGKDAGSRFRILGESLPVALPFTEEGRIMEAEVGVLRRCLEGYYPLCSGFEEPFKSAIEARDQGCHIVRFSLASSADPTLSRHLILPLWKSNVSITLMIDKKAKSALSLRLFGEDITTAGKETAKEQQAKAASKAAAASSSNVTPMEDVEDTMGVDVEGEKEEEKVVVAEV